MRRSVQIVARVRNKVKNCADLSKHRKGQKQTEENKRTCCARIVCRWLLTIQYCKVTYQRYSLKTCSNLPQITLNDSQQTDRLRLQRKGWLSVYSLFLHSYKSPAGWFMAWTDSSTALFERIETYCYPLQWIKFLLVQSILALTDVICLLSKQLAEHTNVFVRIFYWYHTPLVLVTP